MADSPPEQPLIHTSEGGGEDAWNVGEAAAFLVDVSQSTKYASPTPPPIQASQTSQASAAGHKLRKKGAGTGAWNTPITRTETSAQTFGFEDKTAKSRNLRLGEEMKGRMLGPMPVEDFLREFLSADTISFKDMPSPKSAFSRVPKKSDKITKETDIYAPLIKALNADTTPGHERGSRCPGFTFRDTSNHPDTSGGVIGGKKPDVCCYKDDHLEAVKASDSETSLRSRTDMGLVATFFEIKLRKESDFFCDPHWKTADDTLRKRSFVFGDSAAADLPELQESFGQNVAYASEVGMRQFRQCVYSLSMAGTRVRLIRWDRAGAVVSKGFDIHKNPEHLCRFLWCFSHVSDSERGYDLTVEPATAEDANLFESLIKEHIKRQLPLASSDDLEKALKEHYSVSCVTSVSVRRKSDEGLSYQYLVSRPIVAPISQAGRATRTYWAVDRAARKVVFLKDTWRQTSDKTEGSIMKDLQSRHVPNIPPVEYEGDVPSVLITRDAEDDIIHIDDGCRQTTRTQKFLSASWVCGDPKVLSAVIFRRIRYRLVLQFAGYPLTKFRGTDELLHGVHDAFIALHDAYGITRRLHCDITPGNIILYHDGSPPTEEPRKGYLVDWELSFDPSAKREKTRRRDASMYWQFASLDILEKEDAPHTIQDDMESIYYVVLYCALLYLPHLIEVNELLRLLGLIFDFSTIKNGTRAGGGMVKSADLREGAYTGSLPWTEGSRPIRKWLEFVRGDISLHRYNPPKPPAPAVHADGWTPASFKTFWDAFFTKYGSNLPREDRTDHIKANGARFAKTAPRGALGIAFQPTIPCAYSPYDASTTDLTSATAAPHASSSTAVPTLELWRAPRDPTGRVSPPSPDVGPWLAVADTPGSTTPVPQTPGATVGLSGPVHNLTIHPPAKIEGLYTPFLFDGPYPPPDTSTNDAQGGTKSKGKSTSVDARPTKKPRRSTSKS
ncbi:hypothetical protein VTO73DRAFT_5220 [Trametes versicolor]